MTDLNEFFREAMATNWEDHYDKIPDEIHRGLFAPESSHVFSAPAADEDIAHGLIHAHQEEQFGHNKDRDKLAGVHWTTDEGIARGFAKEHEESHHTENPNDCDHEDHFNATPVVFHAEKPAKHEIEHDERRLGWQNVYDHDHPEKEVPIGHGKPVRIKGVSWRTHENHPITGGDIWHRHDLKEPVTLRAHDDETPDDENQWNGERPSAKTAGDDDYKMQHQPPGEEGIPIHNMTHNLPADIYTHPHYYSDMTDVGNRDAHNVISRVRDKPEARVKIYRSMPAEHVHEGIKPGNWVTTSKEYAREHSKHPTDPKHDWPVISATVKAKHLHTDADDFREYGYNGPDVTNHGVAFRGGEHQRVSPRADGTVRKVVPKKEREPDYDGPSKDYSFSGGRGPGGISRVNAWDPDGNYAGHSEAEGGKITKTHIEPEHAHLDLPDRLRHETHERLPDDNGWHDVKPPVTKTGSMDLVEFFKTAGGPLIFYPAKHGGKYHLTDSLSETARCRGSVEVDKTGEPIHVSHDQEKVHPIVCKRCLDSGRAAQGKGEHVAVRQPSTEYSYTHTPVGVSTIIDAHHKRDGIVGSAEFDNDDGTLHEIEVHPDHRRKGIATGMWNHAKTVGLNPQHSNVRSRQGDAWANSMATPVPDNVWPNQDAKPSEDGIENDHFSTAFTAPGYHHPYTNEDFPEALGYAPKRRTAALHDIALPKPGDNYYKSDEEKAANKAKYDGEIKEFHSKVKQEAGLPEDAALLEAKRHWDRGIKHALTTGDMTIDEAEAKNYHGDHREHGDSGWEHDYKRHGGWQNLASNSNHYAHVSTDADAAAKDGLKTRHELNQLKGGSGLGGGSDDTVSVTDDKDLPNDIYHALHEHHAVVSGKITPEQLHNYAKNPPHGMTPFHESIVKPGSPEEDDFERLKKGVDSKGDPLSEEDKTSQHSQFYKRFSTMREYAGKGHRDPLFMSNDPVAFSKTDPKKFGIMHLKPHPKAQGYPLNPGQSHHGMADSGEWRMGSGSPFDVDHVERPTPRHVNEFALNGPSEHGKVASIADISSECHCASCNSLGMTPPGSDCTARKTAAVKVHCAECGGDYFIDSEDEKHDHKTAKVRDVRDADSDAGAKTGIMVAIVPPKSIVKSLEQDEGEAPEQMHLTMAFLGDTSDYKPEQVENLSEVIEAWAEGTAKFEATTQGAGTFVKAEEDGQHVLWASVDAPGLHRLSASLVDYLKEQGYEPKEDHVFVPHITLAYGKHHFRFIPKVERETWMVKEVWCCIGGIWESHPLKG